MFAGGHNYVSSLSLRIYKKIVFSRHYILKLYKRVTVFDHEAFLKWDLKKNPIFSNENIIIIMI